jgi:hypothetical protein
MSGPISISPGKLDWGIYGMIYLTPLCFSGGKNIDLYHHWKVFDLSFLHNDSGIRKFYLEPYHMISDLTLLMTS